MNRRQHLRQIARQFLIARSPCKATLRPLAALCTSLPVWAEAAGARVLLALDGEGGGLSEDQKWGAAIAAATAVGNADLISTVLRDAEGRITHRMRDLARLTAVTTLLGEGAAGLRFQDRDAQTVALCSVAAAGALPGHPGLQQCTEAARRSGVSDDRIASIFGIATALSTISTVLNGTSSQSNRREQDRPHLR